MQKPETPIQTTTPFPWMPIDTAPKDGTRLLAYFPFASTSFVVRWDLNIYEPEHNWTLDDGESATLTYDHPACCLPLPVPYAEIPTASGAPAA